MSIFAKKGPRSAAPGGGGIGEAPDDDALYGRKNKAWVEVPGGEGGGKPKATGNKTATLVSGSKRLPQAFADLDAFDYTGTPYTGTIIVPAGYAFGTADSMVLSGRQDCGWLNIASAQFPTAHSITSAPTAGNVLGYFSALIGLLSSTIGGFQVSLDGSGISGLFYSLYAQNANIMLVGDAVSSTKAIFKASSSKVNGVFINESMVAYSFIDADVGVISGNTLGGANFRVAGSGSGGFTISGNNTGAAFGITVGNDARLRCYGNPFGAQMLLESGSLSAYIGIGTGPFTVVASSASNCYLKPKGAAGFVFEALDDLTFFCSGSYVKWRPQATSDALWAFGNSTISGKIVTIDSSNLEMDTTDVTPFYAFAILQYTRNSEISVRYPSSWAAASTGISDILPNKRNALNTLLNDPQTPAWDWTAPTLLNSWANYGSTRQDTKYRVQGDRVDIHFAVISGTANTVFELPSALRPEKDTDAGAITVNSGGATYAARVSVVAADGSVNIVSDAPANDYAFGTVSFFLRMPA